MKILAFDTSTVACSVAIQNAGQIKFLHKNAPMQQTRLILPMIRELLESFSLTFDQLDAIAYGCGPGSFTGIRIANSVAQGIGFAAQKPIIQISSLAAHAQAAFSEHQCTKILVAVDARMHQVYWAFYEVGQKGLVELIGRELLCTPEEVSTFEKSAIKSNGCGVGDGWDAYSEDLMKSLGFRPESIYASQLPSATAILELARIKLNKRQWITAAEAVPVYLR